MGTPPGRPRRAGLALLIGLVSLAPGCRERSSSEADRAAPVALDAWRVACLRPSSVPGLEREIAPGLDLELDGLHVQTGSLGQRGPDFADDPRAFRIAALGGSFTFGLGLDQGEDWPSALQVHINHSMLVAGASVEVTNLGTPDAQLPGQVGLFDARLEARPPWILVVEIDLDDLAGAQPQGRVERVRALLADGSELRQRSEQALAALRERCAPAGIGVLVLITPLDAGVPWAEYPLADLHGELTRAVTRNGLAPLDLLEVFSGEEREALRAEEPPAHWNAHAQDLAKEAIKREFFRSGLLMQALEAH